MKRETLATSSDVTELQEKIKEEAEKLNLGEARDRNDHGPVYINAHYDLRIERDPGAWGEYRLTLLQKNQAKPSFMDRLRRG